MVTEKFRRQLRHESEKWWTEGLIHADFYEQLADRYQFHTLEHDASNRFIAILMGLGAVLLGLGAITFVAANWLAWSRLFKILLLLSLFIGINTIGFYLWRRPPHKRFQKLGHGLLILGALMLGANMALMSQMFHQSGNFYELLFVWGLGVTAMAYSLRLSSLGCLALFLIGWGYLLGWVNWTIPHEASMWQFFVRHMPLVSSLVFVPLAYWCRSREIFALSALLTALSLVCNLRPFAGVFYGHLFASGWIAALAFVLPPALLWAFDRSMWQFSRSRSRHSEARYSEARHLEVRHSEARHSATASRDGFQPIARAIALCFLSIVFYILAFRWLWNAHPASDYYPVHQWHWEPFIDAIVLSLFAGLGWLQFRHQFRHALRYRRFQERAINTATVAGMLVVTAGLLIWQFDVGSLPLVAIIGFNSLLFLLAIALIRDGLALGDRPIFWAGMVLLVVGIVSRMLEYNTGLLLKSIVFALCGIGIILAGLWFERNIKPSKTLVGNG